jgi:small conductance mechanosensitive channel
LNTVDNRLVIIPNNDVVNNPLVNYSAEQFRKLDVKIGISYNSSIIKAKELIKNILSKDERILNEPETPLIVVDELGTSSVILLVRAWINSDQLLDLKYDFLESVKTEFDKAGIIIPFPQTDIHLYEHRTD